MIYISMVGLAFFMEYYVKRHMDRVRSLQEQRPLAGGNIVLKKYYNTGAAGNFLDSYPKWVRRIHICALLTALLAFVCILQKKGAAAAKTGLSFLVGGGLSNLHDRLTKGYVVDYVSFGFGPKRFRRLVFNMADFFVFAGILLCGIEIFRKDRQKE
ncbi:MAG: signal peptidase II [Eubacterium sp.]|nr:signal peptidase II [Eubacterium sp.]